MEKSSKVYVAGHRGMVGSAIVRELNKQGYNNIITRTHKELDLTRQDKVEKFFAEEKPEYVFLAAAKVGNMIANATSPADFIYENMMIEMNVICSAYKYDCKKIIFLGSSCMFPFSAPQPLKEEYILTSPLEEDTAGYSLAKIAGMRYCLYLNQQYNTQFIVVIPTNLYGPNDNYEPSRSHVLPAFIRRFHEAKINGFDSVECWGDGTPIREFLFVDDLAELCLFLMNNYNGEKEINASTGKGISVKKLAEIVADIVGYKGKILWNTSKPNGTMQKVLDATRATSLGWKYKTELNDGIKITYEDFLNNFNVVK